MKPTIRSFTAGELTELALLAETLNARRETGSAFCCSLAEDIRKDFLNTMEYNFVFREGGVPKGLFCCFPDPEKRNADCSLLVDATGEEHGLSGEEGRLADIAPTLLALIGLEPPAEMTGKSLLA